MEVGEHLFDHLGRGLAQAVALLVVHPHVARQALLHRRLPVELAQQGDEVEHVEDAGGQVVGARRGVEGGRGAEQVGERDVGGGLLGGGGRRGRLVAREEVAQALAQGRVERRLILAHGAAEKRRLPARGRGVPAGGVEGGHHHDESRLRLDADAVVGEVEGGGPLHWRARLLRRALRAPGGGRRRRTGDAASRCSVRWRP